MNTKKYFFAFALLLFVFALVPLQSQAQGLVQCGGAGQAACQLCDLFILITTIINALLFTWVPVIALPFLVMGGIYMILAGTSPANFKKAKDILQSVVIGLILVYAAYGLVGTVLTSVGVGQWKTDLGQWFQPKCIT